MGVKSFGRLLFIEFSHFKILLNSLNWMNFSGMYVEYNEVLLINDWSVILLCLPCNIFHEYMCRFLLFTEFLVFCYEI